MECVWRDMEIGVVVLIVALSDCATLLVLSREYHVTCSWGSSGLSGPDDRQSNSETDPWIDTGQLLFRVQQILLLRVDAEFEEFGSEVS